MMKPFFEEIDTLISEFQFPIFNFKEYEKLITSIKNIRGLKSKKREVIEEIVDKNFLKKEPFDDFFIYLNSEKNIDIYDIANTRSRSSFFSFYTALSIHNLTLNIPKSIYLTNERKSLAPQSSILTQESIDKAFKKPPKSTQNKRRYGIYSINLVNGQFQGKTGLIPFRNHYWVSDIERTLIDISVRPFCSGGVIQVLSAFENAKKVLDTEKLFEYYNAMNFAYPYHQVIGFYLEKSGYAQEHYEKFLSMDKKFTFYLTHNILHKEFSEKWNLYFPLGM